MANTKEQPKTNYAKYGIIAVVVIAVALAGVYMLRRTMSNTSDSGVSTETAISEVTPDAVNGADLRMAVVRMDAIQSDARALQDLRKQKEKYENQLRDDLNKQQKALEKEKTEIEKSQDVLSRDALQRRVMDYQARVTKLQRDVTERAQSIEESFQRALAQIQEKHLDPVVEGIIAKKNLSLVIDGRFARTGANIANLDITDEGVNALNKKVSSVKMDKPKGF